MPDKEQDLRRKESEKVDWNIRPYLAIGLIALLVIGLSIVFIFVILRYSSLARGWKILAGILQPVLIGLGIAYLLNPLVTWQEKHLLPVLEKISRKRKNAVKAARGLAIFGALLMVFFIILILMKMVIPQLYSSIEKAVVQIPDQTEAFLLRLQNYINSESALAQYLNQAINTSVEYLESWMKTDLLPQTKTVITALTTGVISAVKTLLNVIIGIVISVYVLLGKETLVGRSKKLVYAFLPAKRGNEVIEVARKTHQIFGGFIFGKIIDSIIMGLLCFAGTSLLQMPYSVLVSVVVGVTNVIPFFGPFIGGAPCALLILLASPVKGLIFIVFILALQQIDGNIIGPRILQESTGLSSFWVIVSIIVGAGLYGFAGMVLAVPVFGTIYYLVQRITEAVLQKKGLSRETADYIALVRVEPASMEMEYMAESKEEPDVLSEETDVLPDDTDVSEGLQ